MSRLSSEYLSKERRNLLKDYNEEGMSRITNEELLELDVKVLIPAALENQDQTPLMQTGSKQTSS